MDDTIGNADGIARMLDVAGNSSSGDGAAIVFAVIGIMVLVMWVPYAVVYAYQLADDDEKTNVWFRLDSIFTKIGSEDIPLNLERSGELKSIKLTMGADDGNFLALVGEIGHHIIEDKNKTTNALTLYKDAYFLLGPSLIFGSHIFNFQLDFLGGSSLHNNIGFMSKAQGTFNFGLGGLSKGLNLGLHGGAIYTDIKSYRGITRDIDSYHYIFGLNLGYRF